MERAGKERNEMIDLMRLLAAFLVICVHMDYYGKEYVLPIARTAVPFFFCLSGYLMENAQNHILFCKRQTIKLLKWNIMVNSFYALFLVIKDYRGEKFKEYLVWIKMGSVQREIWLFNHSPFSEPLWFLLALLYAFIIALILYKCNSMEYVIIIVPILLVLALILNQYSLLVFGKVFPTVYVRNFIFEGFPFLYIGFLIARIKQRKNLEEFKKRNILFAFILSIMVIYFERMVLIRQNCFVSGEFYFGTIIQVITLVLFAIISPPTFGLRFFKWLSVLGRDNALMIYIFHPFLISVIKIVFPSHWETPVYNVMMVFVVFFASLFFGFLYNKVKQKMHDMFTNS